MRRLIIVRVLDGGRGANEGIMVEAMTVTGAVKGKAGYRPNKR